MEGLVALTARLRTVCPMLDERTRLTAIDPALNRALEAVVADETRGDPQSPLRWTCKSTRAVARALTARHHPVSHTTVGQLLHELGYSLQGNRKTEEGRDHPDRAHNFATSIPP